MHGPGLSDILGTYGQQEPRSVRERQHLEGVREAGERATPEAVFDKCSVKGAREHARVRDIELVLGKTAGKRGVVECVGASKLHEQQLDAAAIGVIDGIAQHAEWKRRLDGVE